MSELELLGESITVNEITEGYQLNAAVTVLADGKVVTVWQDPSGYIFARLYNSPTEPLGGAIEVNPGVEVIPGAKPSVAALSGGGFVVAWQSGSGSDSTIEAQRFDAVGEYVGVQVTVQSEAGKQIEPRVVGRPDGGFLVTWDTLVSNVHEDVRGRIYDASGNPAGGAFVINTTTANAQLLSTIAVRPDGSFLVSWESADNPISGAGSIRARNFDAAGSGGAEFIITDAPGFQMGSDVAVLPNGNTIHSWASTSQTQSFVYVQIFDVFGQEVTDPIAVASENGPIAATSIVRSDGGAVVTWTVDTGSQSKLTTLALGEDGQPASAAVVVSEGQGFRTLTSDGVAAVDGDTFVLVWNEQEDGGPEHDIFLCFVDKVAGGLDETFHCAPGGSSISCGDGNDIVFGNVGVDNCSGDDGNDLLYGGANNDGLGGGKGNDTLVGNDDIFALEPDSMSGDDGNDAIYAERTDTVHGGSGTDIVYAVNAFDFTLDMGATSFELAQMDFGNDFITAATQTVGVTVVASGGNDTIVGSAFADILFGGVGNDAVQGGNGNDGIVGDLGIDSLDGGEGDDLVYFDDQDSFVFGGNGFDAGYITTGAGTTVNTAASSLEFIQDLAGGNDTILGSTMTAALIVASGGGNDSVEGAGFADLFYGGEGNDTLTGHGGNDTLVGQGGTDILSGGAGIDILYGNAGAGGDGVQDIFKFQHAGAANADAVYDFQAGIDKIDLTAFGSSFANVSILDGGGSSNVYLNGQLICTVVGAAGTLTAADFLI